MSVKYCIGGEHTTMNMIRKMKESLGLVPEVRAEEILRRDEFIEDNDLRIEG